MRFELTVSGVQTLAISCSCTVAATLTAQLSFLAHLEDQLLYFYLVLTALGLHVTLTYLVSAELTSPTICEKTTRDIEITSMSTHYALGYGLSTTPNDPPHCTSSPLLGCLKRAKSTHKYSSIK